MFSISSMEWSGIVVMSAAKIEDALTCQIKNSIKKKYRGKMPMISLRKRIESSVISWIETGDALNSKEFNKGLFADFASSIANDEGCEIVGIYDFEDIDVIQGQVSDNFKLAVENYWIGHTSHYRDGLFFE